MVALRGCVWDMTRYTDTVNELAVRILLECILVERMILGCVIPQQIKKKIKRFREHEYMHKILSEAVFMIQVRIQDLVKGGPSF